MNALKRSLKSIAAVFVFGLGLYAGGVKANITACLLAGTPLHYCQDFTDVAAMLAAVGSNPFYSTPADCSTNCY